jgi:nucleotide-binding universal stress UspA family protein
MLGSSFPMKLVEGSRCPVVVVPKTWTPGHGSIVVGIQGDGSDEAAVAFAAHEARVLHRELRVVHSWYLPTVLEAGSVVQTAEVEIADSHDAVLAGTLDTLRAAHPELGISGVLAKGDAAEVLEREAAGQELLVVGSHGWTVMDRFFLGSVSREILGRPVGPVAVVRPRRPASAAAS